MENTFKINGKVFVSGNDITVDRAYELYDNYKLCTLIKILNEESEVSFYEEDNEERLTNTEERDTKVSVWRF